MLHSQEPKYGIRDGQIVNRSSGAPIPDDEPILIFRWKDRLAVRTLTAYFGAITDPAHARAVAARLDDFKRFAREHPERMKDPDTHSAQAE